MRRSRFQSATAVLGLMLAVVILACSDTTAPIPSLRSAKHPLIGIYDVTTVLDSFSFEGVGSDCPSMVSTCALVRPLSGGLLQGTLTVGDSVIVIDTVFGDVDVRPIPTPNTQADQLPLVRAEFVGRPCANVDFATNTGCLALGDTVRDDYTRVETPITTALPPLDQRRFTTMISDTSVFSTQTLNFITTRHAGDTIWGLVRWTTGTGRHPPTFTGTFRAVQRP